MTFFIRIFALISLCYTHSLATYAQEVLRLSEERLLSIANGELEGFAYVLAEEASEERIEGSCLYFFRMDESGYALDIEIDNCSHDDIFPQEAVGVMRVGDSVDFFEGHFSDQDEVVVSTNVPI